MFEQITPLSHCCSEPMQALYLCRVAAAAPPCRAEYSKYARIAQNYNSKKKKKELVASFQNESNPEIHFKSAAERSAAPLWRTGAVTPREATEAIPSSNVTHVWSRHRNPLALKKSSHLRCASLPTVLFSVVCLSLCLFVRCCI